MSTILEQLRGAADELVGIGIPDDVDVSISIEIHGVDDRQLLLAIARRMPGAYKFSSGGACWIDGKICGIEVSVFYTRGLLGEPYQLLSEPSLSEILAAEAPAT